MNAIFSFPNLIKMPLRWFVGNPKHSNEAGVGNFQTWQGGWLSAYRSWFTSGSTPCWHITAQLFPSVIMSLLFDIAVSAWSSEYVWRAVCGQWACVHERVGSTIDIELLIRSPLSTMIAECMRPLTMLLNMLIKDGLMWFKCRFSALTCSFTVH